MDSKKVDKWLMIISGILLVIGIFVFYFSRIVGGNFISQAIIKFAGLIIIVYSTTYLAISVLIRIFQSIFKKLSNHFKAKVWFKVIISIIITVVIVYLLGNLSII